MSRNRIEDEERLQREIEEGVKRLFTTWMIRVCRTSTIAILGGAMWVGGKIVDHSDRVMKALSVLFGDGK